MAPPPYATLLGQASSRCQVLGATHGREPRLSGPYTEKEPFHHPFVMFAYFAGITTRLVLVTGMMILRQRRGFPSLHG